MRHFKINVKGKVQGVFYRASTREKADDLGLKGWVRNEPDGTVTIEAEGVPEQLDALVLWCKSGPPRAKVEDVEVEESDHLQGFNKFEVRK